MLDLSSDESLEPLPVPALETIQRFETRLRELQALGYVEGGDADPTRCVPVFEAAFSPGRVEVEVDASGQPVGRGVVDSVAPRPGRNVELSIDLDTQRALEEALRTQVDLSGLAEGAPAGVLPDNKVTSPADRARL